MFVKEKTKNKTLMPILFQILVGMCALFDRCTLCAASHEERKRNMKVKKIANLLYAAQ